MDGFYRQLLNEFCEQFSTGSTQVVVQGQAVLSEGPGDARLVSLARVLDQPAIVLQQDVLLFAPVQKTATVCGVRKGESRTDEIHALREFATRPRGLPVTPPSPQKQMPKKVGGYIRGLKFLEGRFSTFYGAMAEPSMATFFLRRLEGPAEARRQLLREARSFGKLAHQNLLRYVETLEDEGDLYLVFEAVSGTTLDKRTGRVDGKMLRFFLHQFRSVLNYLHRHHIVHRDLRPENVWVSPNGTLKLLDFALSRMREHAHDPRPTLFKAQGDPVYAAPEQLLGRASHPSNDAYSVGSILYFLASGQHPAQSLDRLEGTAVEPALDEIRPDLDAGLLKEIETLRQPDPVGRAEL